MQQGVALISESLPLSSQAISLHISYASVRPPGILLAYTMCKCTCLGGVLSQNLAVLESLKISCEDLDIAESQSSGFRIVADSTKRDATAHRLRQVRFMPGGTTFRWI